MMLRVLFCISCCSPPPNNRAKRRTGSKQSSKQDLRERKVSQEELQRKDAPASILATAGDNGKVLSLASQLETKNGNDYGTRDGDQQQQQQQQQQGKLMLPMGIENDDEPSDQMIPRVDSFTASPSTSLRLKRADAIDYSDLNPKQIERLKELGAEFTNTSTYDEDDGGSVSPPSSIDVGPFTERNVGASYAASYDVQRSQSADAGQSQELPDEYQQVPQAGITYESIATAEGGDLGSSSTATISQRYEPLTSTAKNVPSTTKIGDYARIEYSPIEDLDSLTTTMSYSRFGSEKGGSRSRSQAGSLLSRQNSLKANVADDDDDDQRADGSVSRRSSHGGGIESTSISIASQLSNEQFQQNLTNMLESVNTNYPNFDTIGLPLGPPLEGTMTETTKTSPETPGAALTSASQDSLSDVAFDDMSPVSSRPGTLRSNVSMGAALVGGGDSVERTTLTEDMAELAQPAPLASGEDEDGQQSYPSSGVGAQRFGGSERVDTPQSIATTTSAGLTNPTPTPSEMSGGSGKKKRSKAKSLFKKLKPGSKKSKTGTI